MSNRIEINSASIIIDDPADIEIAPSGLGDEWLLSASRVLIFVDHRDTLGRVAHLLLDAYIGHDLDRATEAQDWIMEPFRVGVPDPYPMPESLPDKVIGALGGGS